VSLRPLAVVAEGARVEARLDEIHPELRAQQVGVTPWLLDVGYGRTAIAEAMAIQAGKLHYTRSSNPSAPTIRLAKRLSNLAPDGLSKIFVVSGGSEANETAMKMASWHR
jgi:adenosylmethionine-8-amino-7-oxononanoate aminotransferase